MEFDLYNGYERNRLLSGKTDGISDAKVYIAKKYHPDMWSRRLLNLELLTNALKQLGNKTVGNKDVWCWHKPRKFKTDIFPESTNVPVYACNKLCQQNIDALNEMSVEQLKDAVVDLLLNLDKSLKDVKIEHLPIAGQKRKLLSCLSWKYGDSNTENRYYFYTFNTSFL